MAGSSWAPSFTAGQIIKASEVEARFDWIESHIFPQASGSSTDLAYDLGDTTSAHWRALYWYDNGGQQQQYGFGNCRNKGRRNAAS